MPKASRGVIGVIGNGRATANIIEDSLNEFVDNNDFVLPWYGGKPSDSMDRVYTAIIDFDHPYHIVGNGAPKSLVKTALEHHQSEDPMDATVRATHDLGGDTILVLWDDEVATESAILQAHAYGMRLLDLTNALAPIDVVDPETPAPAPEAPEEDAPEDKEIDKFSEDELRTQPIAALRRQVKLLGLDYERSATKEELISALLGGLQDVGLKQEAPQEVAKAFPIPKSGCLALSWDDKVETITISAETVGAVQEMFNGLKKLLQG
jgi:hypothetical protein